MQVTAKKDVSHHSSGKIIHQAERFTSPLEGHFHRTQSRGEEKVEADRQFF